MKTAAEVLADRLKQLIGPENLRGAPIRIEKDAADKGLLIAHSTFKRMLDGEGVNLDKLEPVAAYFRTDVWRMLCPEPLASPQPTLEHSIEVLARALNNMPEDRRETIAQQLQRLAWSPDSQKAREAVLLLMSTTDVSVAPTAAKVLSAKPEFDTSEVLLAKEKP